MSLDRTPNILLPVTDDLHHLAPVPVIYHLVQDPDIDTFHRDLIRMARESLTEAELDVPDVRHQDDMGKRFEFTDDSWSERQLPAIGVWHGVPTNRFLDNPAPPVQRVKALIDDRYRFAVRATTGIDAEKPWISESWIQFYKDGDYKVLHNHERYGPPYLDEPWSGGYYLTDGQPDASMPYAGMFSFRIRQANYFIKPKAGLLLMWPSDILHEVSPFYGKDERIVVNFNINARAV